MTMNWSFELKEKSDPMREMVLYVRAYNDGAAFRYKLLRAVRLATGKLQRN